MPNVEMTELSNHGAPCWWVRIFYPHPHHGKTEGDVFWDKGRALNYFRALRAKHQGGGDE